MSTTDTSLLPDYAPVPRSALGPVVEKYIGVLAAADVFTESTAFQVMQSIRLDLGYGWQVRP